MKSAWKEFKAFAMGGNLIDLAIGFIIATAFVKVVESLATDVIGGIIAAIGGSPNLDDNVLNIGKGEIKWGTFLGTLINFLIIALVLFLLVKLLKKAKMGNFRAQGQRECPYCREFVAVDAVRCRHCTSELPAIIDGDEGADERMPAKH
jgi:large conductance mechanosensitive channel